MLNEEELGLDNNIVEQVAEGVKPKVVQAKRWCFTSYEDEEPRFDSDAMDFMQFQREKCPDTERLHWQGFVCFKKKMAMGKRNGSGGSGVKGYIGHTAHVEVMKGSLRQNIAYVTKDESAVPGTRKQHGVLPDEEPKFRWQQLKQDVMDPKKKYLDVLADNFQLYIQHGRQVENALHKLRPVQWCRPVVNICLWGGTGVGKTQWIGENFLPEEVYIKDKTEWWDGYMEQQVVVYDDFYGEHKVSNMLNWCDMYRQQVPVKGGFVNLRHTISIFTSNENPRNWWKKIFDEGKEDVQKAWGRRLDMDINCFELRMIPKVDEDGQCVLDESGNVVYDYPEMSTWKDIRKKMKWVVPKADMVSRRERNLDEERFEAPSIN